MSDVTEQDLRDAWAAIAEAMAANDATALQARLADDFVLVHMTGYRQPRDEWTAEIAAGSTVYHAVETVGVDVDLADPSVPVLTARTWTDVTIGGERGRWPTAFRVELVHGDGGWVARSVSGTGWDPA